MKKRDLLISSYIIILLLKESKLLTLRDEFGTSNVHIFGSQRTGEVDKFEILSRSVFNICFENSIGEGYITEKLFHSKFLVVILSIGVIQHLEMIFRLPMYLIFMKHHLFPLLNGVENVKIVFDK